MHGKLFLGRKKFPAAKFNAAKKIAAKLLSGENSVEEIPSENSKT